ncbi:MAG: hypothetical protein KME23_17320 [Goleter apudmare HA4340-LM2]|jgi:hypothetical protein|nr:hypothetical protein [Goleter apudmare HA4340-LM2]
MSTQIITSDLLVDLSTEEQQQLSGGRYGFRRGGFRRGGFRRGGFRRFGYFF